MDSSFEQMLFEVWRQTLGENADVVELGAERYRVRLTPERQLREVDFVFDGNKIRWLEQNRETKSRWVQMAPSGKKIMQFLSEGRHFIAAEPVKRTNSNSFCSDEQTRGKVPQ